MKLPVIKINFVAIYLFFRRILLINRRPVARKFGFNPDKEDPRDIVYKIRRPGLAPASTFRQNINAFPWRYDQGDIGSCVGNGICEAFRRTLQVNKQPDFDPSRLFAYFIARHDKLNDSGASIRDAFKAINRVGVCSENTWPYITSRLSTAPCVQAWKEALDHQTIRYERLPQDKEAIKDAVSRGFPVVYGKEVYESFMTDQVARTGIIPVPSKEKERCYGGHCMAIFDYDENNTIELNSWGKGWGQNGVCEVPWNYVMDKDLCMDFWVMYLTE